MALQKGSDGHAVMNLQKNLNQIGVTKLKEDGLFGDNTEKAVEAFQSAHSLPVTGIVDGVLQDTITKCVVGQLNLPQHGPNPWMPWMRSHVGEKEQTGGVATDFDKEVFSHTSYQDLDGVMEPGCAATVCAALEESGFKSPHDASAESFREFGVDSPLLPGAIVGFNWAGKKDEKADHVAFYDHALDNGLIACLGGNQGSEVKTSLFSKSKIAFVRWPLEKIAGWDLRAKAADKAIAGMNEAVEVAENVANQISGDDVQPVKQKKSKKES